MNWIFAILGLITYILQVEASTICNATQSCPEELPCCSQYGECGTGMYCLGGCNPIFSFDSKACMAMPVCQDISTNFKDYSSKVLNTQDYMGNVSSADWVYTGYLADYDDEDSLLLAMPKNSGGTVLSSTRYVWYGKISAKLKTSHLAGVVTAFIIFSNVQDEIDYEWVGANLTTTQTNYYFEGYLNYTESYNISSSDTFENFHTYEVDWHEDYITWSVDGVVGRTLNRNDTYNSTSQEYAFPQTPSRVQISIWPGGNATNAPGTIDWAGGEIDWDASDLSNPGYYYSTLNEVNITCYDPPSDVKQNGTTAYTFTDSDSFYSDTVAITDDAVMLYSVNGTGLNPDEGKNSTSSSSSSTSSSTILSSSSSGSNSSSSTSTSTDGKKGTTTAQTESTTSATDASTTSLSASQSTGFVQNIKSSSSSATKSISASTQSNAAVDLGVSLGDGLAAVGLLIGYLL